MGTYHRERDNLTCDEEHVYGGDPQRCRAEHRVRAEFSNTSDYCTVIVDDAAITMPASLYRQLYLVMTEVLIHGRI